MGQGERFVTQNQVEACRNKTLDWNLPSRLNLACFATILQTVRRDAVTRSSLCINSASASIDSVEHLRRQ
jgi:hypothetical protein